MAAESKEITPKGLCIERAMRSGLGRIKNQNGSVTVRLLDDRNDVRHMTGDIRYMTQAHDRHIALGQFVENRQLIDTTIDFRWNRCGPRCPPR